MDTTYTLYIQTVQILALQAVVILIGTQLYIIQIHSKENGQGDFVPESKHINFP